MFLRDFYQEESSREKVVLGDVDIVAEPSDLSEPMFFVTLDDIKKKYAEFLGLTQESESNEVENQTHSSEEKHEDHQAKENEAGDLLQEIRDLDQHNPEASYVDFKYWKPMIDYSIDHLLSEMRN